MSSQLRTFLVIIFALAASATACGAQQSGASRLDEIAYRRPVINQKLGISEAIQIALRESPVVRGAAEEVKAALGRLEAARAEARPWVSVNGFASGGSNGNIVSSPAATQPQMIMGLPRGAFADGNLMLMVPLYSGGRITAMVKQAAALRNASEADLKAQKLDVALMVRMAYREVIGRRALVSVSQARLKENQERLRVDNEKYQQGAVPLVTVRRDEAEVAASEQEVTNAQRDVELSLTQLKTVMGISLASQLELTEPNDSKPSTELIKGLLDANSASLKVGNAKDTMPDDLRQLLRLAEKNRPELEAASERVQGAAADTNAARSEYRPQVNAFAMGDLMKSRGNDLFAGTTFGVTASLPLYTGGLQKAHIDTAEAMRRKRETDREKMALQVAQEVSNALLNLRAAEKNVQTARAAVTAAEEGYSVAQQRYQAGRSIVVELLDALATRTQAQSGVVQALFQYNVARDQLLRAVGSLG